MLKENPETTEDELEDSVALMKKQGIVDRGEAVERGIGAMNSARIQEFHYSMVRAGLYKAGEIFQRVGKDGLWPIAGPGSAS